MKELWRNPLKLWRKAFAELCHFGMLGLKIFVPLIVVMLIIFWATGNFAWLVLVSFVGTLYFVPLLAKFLGLSVFLVTETSVVIMLYCMVLLITIVLELIALLLTKVLQLCCITVWRVKKPDLIWCLDKN